MKLPSDPGAILSPSALIQLEAHACYRALISIPMDGAIDPDLGGTLLYAGELDAAGRAMTVAGNIAGCATLAATADGAAQKLAIRDGVVDFVVTSLDEALRILKNEVRKRNCVGVCVGSDRIQIEREMIERGVLADLVFAGSVDGRREVGHFGEHARKILIPKADGSLTLIAWQVAEFPARWMPKLDALAMVCLHDDPWLRRWVRLSPRYLGRAGLSQRAFLCESQAATKITRRFTESVDNGAIPAEVLVTVTIDGESNVLRLRPAAGD